MKKFLCIILILTACPSVFCTPQTSSNSFEINIETVPPGSIKPEPAKHSKSLSDGAVTAITLGSIAGGLGALGGLGWYFTKHVSGLSCGSACGVEKPLQAIFLKDFCKDFSKNKYLEKAFSFAEKSQNRKYLFIPDSEIQNKTYNTIIFEIPENMYNFKIIQASDKLQNNSLNSKIVISDKEIPSKLIKNDLQNSILIRNGKIPKTTEQLAALIIENHTDAKIYAVIIEFSASTD